MPTRIGFTIKYLGHLERLVAPLCGTNRDQVAIMSETILKRSGGTRRASLSRYDRGMASASRPEIDTLNPPLVPIPAGWFLMGCETGRDDEKPVHRVWVDTFKIGAYQVTNAEYAAFLTATKRPPPPVTWDDKNFNSRHQPVVSVSCSTQSHIAIGFRNHSGATRAPNRSTVGTGRARRSRE